jgi:hypothetical protein
MISSVTGDRRRKVWNLPLDHSPGLLRCVVTRTQPSAAGGDHDSVSSRYGIAQRRTDRVAVGHHDRTRNRETKIFKRSHDDGA